MIFVPEFNNNSCCYMYDSNTLRCYKTQPVINSTIEYRDFYVNSHYLYKDGSTQFGNYGYNYNIECLDNSVLTDKYMYRNDISDILLTFVLFIAFVIFMVAVPLKSFFRGLFK